MLRFLAKTWGFGELEELSLQNTPQTIDHLLQNQSTPNLSGELQILESVNIHRASLKLHTLEPVTQLSTIALRHNQWMQKYNTASHDVWEQRHDQTISLGFRSFNENLAGGECYTQEISQLIASCVPGWIASPGHKRTLEKPEFTHTGIGLLIVPHQSKANRIIFFVTQVFAGI